MLAIFITHLNTVFSRHRIRHYRDRFKRQQGANLFLPDSYVTDTDEPEEGVWTAWSSPSACSRTCNGGVSTQTRECETGYTCRGPKFRYISCNTQDCPDLSDFRAQQCSEFDKIPFDGVYYQWVPYTKAPNQCELNCMPIGERFYYRHKQQVADGTRCNDQSPDVCVQGKCRHVGCDMMLGSKIKEDKCRKCGGDGSTCQTITGRYDKQDLQVGYNNIILIPRGATNILVEEIEPSNNYLAIRNTSGHYYLNGNWRIDFPRTKEFAGCAFNYGRTPQGFAAPDTITALGPTDEPLIIVLLYQERNVGVDYEYSVPTLVNPGNDSEIYVWSFDPFNPCSVTCGGGFQYRNVTCVSRQNLNPAEKSLCDSNTKPAEVQECNIEPCSAQWVPYPWGKCSAPCGGKGEQVREITCQQINRGVSNIVDEDQCANQSKPPSSKPCSRGPICPKWHIGPWKPCDHLCGDGKQTRKVKCYTRNGTRVQTLRDEDCTDKKPEVSKPCNLRPCEGVDWISSQWSGCENKCGLSNETRKVHCASINGKIYPDDLCEPELKPESVRECEGHASCDYLFYASQWSECSAKCGQGIQTRTVFCGATDGKTVTKVDISKCDKSKKYDTIRNCTAEKKCAGEWFSGPWKECSRKCGGGIKMRKVICLLDSEVVKADECDLASIIFAQENCNTHSCAEGEEETTTIVTSTTPFESSTTLISEISSTPFETESTTEFLDTTESSSEGSSTTFTISSSSTSTELSSASSESLSSSSETSSSATEQSSMKSTTDSFSTFDSSTPVTLDDDYEIVQADNCDDGIWVDAETLEPLMGDDPYVNFEYEKIISKDPSPEDEELMLSDQVPDFLKQPNIISSDTLSGSGDSELDSSTDITISTDNFEGSGFSSTTDTSSSTEYTEITETGNTTEDILMTETVKSTTDKSMSTDSENKITTDTSITKEGKTTTEEKPPFESEAGAIPEPDVTDKVKVSQTLSTEISSLKTITSAASESTTAFGVTSESEITTEGFSTEKSSETDENVITSTTKTLSSTDIELSAETGLTTENKISTEVDLTTEKSSSSDIELTTANGLPIGSASTTNADSSTEIISTTEIQSTIGSSSTSESDSTEQSALTSESASSSESALTTENASTSESASTTEAGSTSAITSSSESGSTTENGSTIQSASTTEAGPTSAITSSSESGSTTGTALQSTIGSDFTTESLLSTESSTIIEGDKTDESYSTTYTPGISTSESGSSTESASTTISGLTTLSGPTTIDLTTESGSTIVSESTIVSGSTAEIGSTTESYSSTETGQSTETIQSTVMTDSTTKYSESTGSDLTSSSTEMIGSSTSMSSATTTEYVTSDSTESTIKYTESTEVTTEYTGTTESSTQYTGSTKSDLWSSSESTTSIVEIFTKKPRMCKRKKKKKGCATSKHGCCPDKVSSAKGPFDEGCPIPKTCKESKFGCCDDEVSPALGENKKGCPQSHCEETLFGCCPDNKTPAEGNDFEGCPPPPPACLGSKFGCCDDNATEAKGPNKKGCEDVTTEKPKEYCGNTTYGCCPDNETIAVGEDFEGCDIFKPNCEESYFKCCPDGKSSSKGPNFKGCEMPCSNSTFGCCPDGRTPSHGRRAEGCCLVYEHGCCPDNITPARGPQLEGCGCDYSSYGCCPDNQTVARGPNKEGCGCRYSEFGCCPDDFTSAKGVDYQGCSCQTFQFGCCPDGVTAATGPSQQGCGCRSTEFGCCSDDVTPAKGPARAGCDCSSSKFGCCLDGLTDARGENFEGCEEIPVNAQESCNMDKERGSCGNYSVKWFFDKDYGGCSRFWYGGCEGNGNRFKSKEECDNICVKPEGKDRCKLQKVSGPCEGYYVQWHYDSEKGYCEQFVYSGCLGNNNRFETLEECNQMCATDTIRDPCEQPLEEGPCRGNFPRWYFEKDSKSCKTFRYGGCKGNANNFASSDACMQKCGSTSAKKEYCNLPKVEGNCTKQEARWYSDSANEICKPFYYSGCNGNENNFVSEDACAADCPKTIQKDACHLPSETGECANYTDRFYYDTKDRACRHFYYGGCGGNENNFLTQEQCQQRCISGILEPITTPAPATEGPLLPEHCWAPSETGPCRAAMPRYFYDRNDGVCKNFIYGGCKGNRNNFKSIDDCYRHCGGSQDICSLPPVVGDCKGEYRQYHYDQASDTCKEFIFGGCGGNYNRFPDLISCEERCRKSPPIVPTESVPQTPAPRPSQALCYEQPDAGNCTSYQPAYFFNSTDGRCTPFSYTGCGGNHNRFQSEEQCERLCGEFSGQDVCEREKDAGPCDQNYPKYYYNKQTRRCLQFVYGGCGGNGNRFSSARECESLCLKRSETPSSETDPAVCVLPVDKGTCEGGYNKRWYFDNERGECIAFIYSGCGGNFNNFKTFPSCIATCKDYLVQTESPPTYPVGTHPCQTQFEQCAKLRCPYGIDAYVDENNCNNCRCNDPCRQVECAEGTKCAIDFNRNRTVDIDANFIAVCRQTNKEGHCPRMEQDDNTNCEKECYSDADCTLDLKCCRTGCGTVCAVPLVREPSPLVTQPIPGLTESPYYPPKIDEEEYHPEITGEIGGHITLRCAVKGNPQPHISWSKDGLEIDGTRSRYRIKLDQSLQIITLHTTDSGIYLCTADNNLGDPIQNQIKLDVVAPSTNKSASVLSDEEINPNVVVSLNAPSTLYCYALGFPIPAITWWKDDSLIPLKTSQFEVHKDFSLLIHSVQLSNLGIYTCQAYNGIGKAASYSVTVQAKGPYYGKVDPRDHRYLKYIINPPNTPTRPATMTSAQPSTPIVTTISPIIPQTPSPVAPPTYIPPYIPTPHENPTTKQQTETITPYVNTVAPDTPDRTPSSYIVPIKVNFTTPEKRFPVGVDVKLVCDFQGYPAPQLSWYKDGVPLTSSDRINIEVHPTGYSRLLIFKATKADSGIYECEAINAYSRGTSSSTITVEGMYVHPSCTDNKFFANCALIVQSKYCEHKYYARFCCRSCTEAGLLPVDGPHLQGVDKNHSIRSNLV
ncbi:hypothetical protein WA026_017598 [Henosepilachna vigintioctopunctata]|uniref:Papilin n=1 Tax=Henosepilachna vigintioctopunctata TaxID=420089 RepID=A0AAW1UZZ8_9CUCU